MSTFEYTAELQLNDGSVEQIDLEERGWADPDRLANTRVFSLIPKDKGSGWPLLRINVPDGAKPIFKSRNNVGLTAGFQIRTYAAGWFRDGESHWTWVFPNGAIEVHGDDPETMQRIMAELNEDWRNRSSS